MPWLVSGFVARLTTAHEEDRWEAVSMTDPDAQEQWCFDADGYHKPL